MLDVFLKNIALSLLETRAVLDRLELDRKLCGMWTVAFLLPGLVVIVYTQYVASLQLWPRS